jgi:hypothetical protein
MFDTVKLSIISETTAKNRRLWENDSCRKVIYLKLYREKCLKIITTEQILRGKPKSSEKTCPNATLTTTNLTWTETGLHSERPVTDCLSHDTAFTLKGAS